jgi:hypothetical protein
VEIQPDGGSASPQSLVPALLITKALTMASSRSEEFVIPRGYVKQELSDRTTKYIKGEVLQKWLNERKKIFGSKCAFIVSEPRLHFRHSSCWSTDGQEQ